MSLNVQVRLTSSLGPSASSYINEFIILLELSLLTVPYSITPSALTNGLWSLICSFSICSGKGVFINGSSSNHHLMLRTYGTSWLASFLNKNVALFPVYFRPINISPLPYISPYFILANLKRKRAVIRHFVAVNLWISSSLESSLHPVSPIFPSFSFFFLLWLLQFSRRFYKDPSNRFLDYSVACR